MKRFKHGCVFWMSLLAVLCLFMTPVQADSPLQAQSSDETYTSGSFTYSYNSSFLYPELAGTIRIDSYNGSESSLQIPDTLDGLTVTSIGPESFTGDALQKIIIPNTVKQAPINWYYGLITSAFSECSNLRTISFEEGIGTVPPQICWKCTSLQTADIPDGTTEIGENAFCNCTNLTAVYIPASVETIPSNAFSGCSNLVIYGEESSYAQEFANRYGFKFSTDYPSEATDVLLSHSSITLPKGTSITLTSTVIPSKTSQDVTWSSSNPDIASVSNGKVTAEKVGTTMITVETVNGITSSCAVNVTSPEPDSVSLDQTTMILEKGEITTLTATVSPSDASQEVSWSSSDTSIAKISDGIVTAVSIGSATLTAQTPNGKSASCILTVTPPEAISVNLNQTSLDLTVGNSTTLRATVSLSDASQEVSWSSSNPSVVTVLNGKITAVSAGISTVTAKTSNGKSASCTVTVKIPEATSISLNQTSLTLEKGKSSTLTATVSPSNASQEVSWSSSIPYIATVSEGKVTAILPGSATITVKTSNGKTATCLVKVTPPEATSVQLDHSSITLGMESDCVLTATVSPSDASQEVTWSSSNPSVAQVQDGTVVPFSPGTAIITVKTTNGKTASCVVTVPIPEPSSISLSRSTLSLEKGKSFTITAAISPTGSSQKVVWSTTDFEVATVSDGKVTAKNIGTAVITAETSNYLKSSCIVTVTAPSATSVSLNSASISLEKGNTYTLSAKVNPSDASQKVTWSSSDESVATVLNGAISGVSAGTATITVKTSNGKTASCVVTVTKEDLKPIYRLYLPSTGEHLYTSDKNEYDTLYRRFGWGQEGIGWYAPSSGTAVYRLYQPGLKNHLYTTDKNEVRILTTKYGWLADNGGEALYYSGGEIPIYRVYNKGLNGMHHLTTDMNEYKILPKLGWEQEGAKLYAAKIGSPITTKYYK